MYEYLTFMAVPETGGESTHYQTPDEKSVWVTLEERLNHHALVGFRVISITRMRPGNDLTVIMERERDGK